MDEKDQEVIIDNSLEMNEEMNNKKNIKINETNSLKLNKVNNQNNLILSPHINNNTGKVFDVSGPNTKNITIQKSKEDREINIKSSRFPYCIVWTPIPIITYICPSIGHTGIGTSTGVIHDFAASFYVAVDNFAFGKPTKYIKLELSEQEKYNWDTAIKKGDNKYNLQEHNLCTNNCHSHVAYILNQLNYKGKNNYNMLNIWWMLVVKGKYISCCGFFKTYLGFFIILLIIAIIIVIIIIVKR